MADSLEKRFWKRIDKSKHGCWLWHDVAPHRYGKIRAGNGDTRDLLAHRVSWEINIGPIPEGICVLHKCDTPSCVRPDHLFLGTKKDNATDAHRKGRMDYPHSAGGKSRHGESHEISKLTNLRVLEIIAELSKDCSYKTIVMLAGKFNVSIGAIYKVATGKSWVRVTGIRPHCPDDSIVNKRNKAGQFIPQLNLQQVMQRGVNINDSGHKATVWKGVDPSVSSHQ